MFACSCGHQFSIKRGLSTHRRHCQPVEVNIECIAALPTKCLKWSQEDDEALCRHSHHLWETGMLKKELYTLLLLHFPGRSQEAIKKRLQTIKWVPSSDPAPVHQRWAPRLSLFLDQTCRHHHLPLHLLSEALTQAEMALNAKKSLGLTITRDGKRKCEALLPTTYECEGDTINPIRHGDSVHYLGLQFNWKGRVIPKHTAKLDSLLQELLRVPLKPQQRMLLLQTLLVPKFIRELVLDCDDM
ncbi:hypothetical protein E2320_002312 [Naja naja]|nr:hypothetical protein E2320_002312 [Naja naja]